MLSIMRFFVSLFESIIRFSACNGSSGFLKPAGPDISLKIKFWDIGLNIQ